MTVLDDTNVDAFMAQPGTYLILFYSPNLPTIGGLTDIFEEFEEQLKGKVQVMTCDLESLKRTKEYFQLTTLPAILFMKDGEIYGNLAGPASKAKYQSIVKEGLVKMIEADNNKKEKNTNVLSADEMYGC